MSFLLGNPWGLLGLLGIPALIVIHFLQRKARKIPSSTLFLLHRTHRESKAGSRFERFVPSLPFWLQLLSILLLTWLLCEPRFIHKNSVQRIGIVIDSSASMRTSKERYEEALNNAIQKLKGAAQFVEIFALESDTALPTIYRGGSKEDLFHSLKKRKPSLGSHDPTSALRTTRNLIGAEGSLIFLTDHMYESLPFNSALLAIGESVPNCGITGVDVIERDGQTLWRAIVRNYSDTPQTRSWLIESIDGQQTGSRTISIEPFSLTSIQAPFPTDTSSCIVRLEEDAFPLDDTYPIIVPKSKSLAVHLQTSERYQTLSKKITQGFENIRPNADISTSDIVLLSYDPLSPTLPENNAIVFLDEKSADADFLAGGIIAASDPLVDGLNWQSLILRDSIRLETLESDNVLLWQDDEPLVLLRELAATQNEQGQSIGPYKQLIFNFDLALSNALKLPATAVLLHRFIEDIRKNKPAEEQRQLETNQVLRIATDPNKDTALAITHTPLNNNDDVVSTLATAGSPYEFTTPYEPSFLTISQGEQILLKAAVGFGDSREADFSQAVSLDETDQILASSVDIHTNEDSYWRYWVLLTILLLLLIWHLILRKREQQETAGLDGIRTTS